MMGRKSLMVIILIIGAGWMSMYSSVICVIYIFIPLIRIPASCQSLKESNIVQSKSHSYSSSKYNHVMTLSITIVMQVYNFIFPVSLQGVKSSDCVLSQTLYYHNNSIIMEVIIVVIIIARDLKFNTLITFNLHPRSYQIQKKSVINTPGPTVETRFNGKN